MKRPAANTQLAARITYLSGQIATGAPFTYTITLTNNGIATVTNVSLSNTIPIGATILSTSTNFGTIAVTNRVLSWSLGSLPNGAAATFNVTVMPTPGGTFDNEIEFAGGSEKTGLGKYLE